MASLDSFVVFLKSSLDLNLCFLVSSHDNVSSLKKKAEAEHLSLFPRHGRIVVRTIKIMQDGILYHLADSMPISCLANRATGICFLFMDAVTVGVHHKRGSSWLGNTELQREGKRSCKARSLEHFSEQFAFGHSDRGKVKLHQSDNNRKTGSPNRETLKMQKHGVTTREPGPDSQEIFRVESLGGEERDRGLSSEKYCSIEESGLANKKLKDQIARINQIEPNKLSARLLQEEINQELQTSDEEMLDGIDVVTKNLQGDKDCHDANCSDNEPSASHHHQLNEFSYKIMAAKAKANQGIGKEGAKWRGMEWRKALGVEMKRGGNLNLIEKERHDRAVGASFKFFQYKKTSEGVDAQDGNRACTDVVTKAQRQHKPPPEFAGAGAAAASSSVAAPQAEPARKSKRRSQLTAAEKRSEAYKRVPHDFSFRPPPSCHHLLQEKHWFDPWRVLVICMLLNITTGNQVRKVLEELFTLCPDAETTTKVDVEHIENVIRSLGLQRKRARMIKRFSEEYLRPDWTHVTNLHGIGKYAADAYAIFCTGMGADVRPDDHKLNDYWNVVYGKVSYSGYV